MRKIGLTLALAVAAHSVGAQGVRVARYGIPRGHLPPPGMCRVWYDNLPPGRQPPATTCERAEREAWRTGGRVVYGERWNDRNDRNDRNGRDDRWNDRGNDRGRRDRDRRDRDRQRDRNCSYNDRRNDCDWREDGCRDRDRDRDRDRNGRCDRDVRNQRGALDELLWGVINGRVQRRDGVRLGPGGWSRTEVTDSVPDGAR